MEFKRAPPTRAHNDECHSTSSNMEIKCVFRRCCLWHIQPQQRQAHHAWPVSDGDCGFCSTGLAVPIYTQILLTLPFIVSLSSQRDVYWKLNCVSSLIISVYHRNWLQNLCYLKIRICFRNMYYKISQKQYSPEKEKKKPNKTSSAKAMAFSTLKQNLTSHIFFI